MLRLSKILYACNHKFTRPVRSRSTASFVELSIVTCCTTHLPHPRQFATSFSPGPGDTFKAVLLPPWPATLAADEGFHEGQRVMNSSVAT